MSFIAVEPVRSGAAEQVLSVIRSAFGDRPRLDPPADADSETIESVSARLAAHGGLLATMEEGEPAGALLFEPAGERLYLRRFGVVPAARGRGVAETMLATARTVADADYEELAVVAREELPATVRFWERHGFREASRNPPYVELSRPTRVEEFDAPDAGTMRQLGHSLALELAAGDLVLLTGDLGAGKTTFAQGIGRGLGVRGPITSPTFVIARVHPSEAGGPALVHVDAYRLGSALELDDLDLDTSLDEAVTVVEWGEGLADGLAESRLEVRIARAGEADGDDDPRRVEVTAVGPRWPLAPRLALR